MNDICQERALILIFQWHIERAFRSKPTEKQKVSCSLNLYISCTYNNIFLNPKSFVSFCLSLLPQNPDLKIGKEKDPH